jgi:hypothetical protein
MRCLDVEEKECAKRPSRSGEGLFKFTPPLGEECSLFVTKEFTVGFTEIEGG